MSKDQIHNEVEQTFTAIKDAIGLFDAAKFNKIPFEGSWTAGQVAEHICKADSGIGKVLNGEIKDTDRDPKEKIKVLKNIFLDYSTKMKSPDFILPEEKDYSKEEFLSSFEDVRSQLKDAVSSLDLTKTCLAFELPKLGYLTRIELIYFVIYHTQRHTHQLNEIYNKLSK